MLKRVTGVLALGAITVFVSASAALAQTSTYPVSLKPSTSVEGTGGGTGGGTAFTGSSQVPLGALLIGVLVVAGIAALIVARRRAARFVG